jgi:coenzyme Q-binding protein COQ10
MPTHAERRILRHTPEEIFQLVADVHRYPEFLPWCVGARVLSRDETKLVADLTIGFRMIRETFRSDVTLARPHLVQVRYLDGPFRYLNNTWKLTPAPQGTEVDFFVDFEFRSRLLQGLIGTVFNEATRLMVRAFERRAMHLYGRNSALRATPAPEPAPPDPAPLPTPGGG